jgi:hypothetical protein
VIGLATLEAESEAGCGGDFVRAHPHERFDGDRAGGVVRRSFYRSAGQPARTGIPAGSAPPRVDPTPD